MWFAARVAEGTSLSSFGTIFQTILPSFILVPQPQALSICVHFMPTSHLSSRPLLFCQFVHVRSPILFYKWVPNWNMVCLCNFVLQFQLLSWIIKASPSVGFGFIVELGIKCVLSLHSSSIKKKRHFLFSKVCAIIHKQCLSKRHSVILFMYLCHASVVIFALKFSNDNLDYKVQGGLVDNSWTIRSTWIF